MSSSAYAGDSPTWSDALRETQINYSKPLLRGAKLAGCMAVGPQ
jgi:hypothetical protein